MLVIAHRGASGYAPENSHSAICRALEMNVDAIEIDLHCVEGELLVIHDRWLHRTTQARGQLKDYTLAQLREIDAGDGKPIPTLWEVLQLVDGRCDLNLELKCEHTLIPTLKNLDQAVNALNFTPNQFLISSFNHHLLNESVSLQPKFATGALIASCPIDYAAFAQQLGCYAIHLDIDFINQAFVDDAKARGLKVFVYTVDEESDIRYLEELGVDGIFSNYPDKALRAVKRLDAEYPHQRQGLIQLTR
ncbi:glycerophosphodiester phosphodiesterase [Corallincola luteus]|uniref:Glycerophosphodiester phosphodiesterase n=1 Tax=Corallincola luteus TaxID=1775177 RepID=A0ABY2ANZ2_9GAMM|nr:glycerophosphodiester phosphodiesterase family protein [Corallincola luteus]TCI04636.1 glycerophosphodiester phosphodiesterase [Corallincola luteus]